tara:strand:+ start:246 stop:449 length:204 start_codon:yes stop_codon:yes gene_type:complete
MAIYKTGSDSANTMVREFLTKIGESYLNHLFNTGSGKGKEIWQNKKINLRINVHFVEKNLMNLQLNT